jgi:hypothetical protein
MPNQPSWASLRQTMADTLPAAEITSAFLAALLLVTVSTATETGPRRGTLLMNVTATNSEVATRNAHGRTSRRPAAGVPGRNAYARPAIVLRRATTGGPATRSNLLFGNSLLGGGARAQGGSILAQISYEIAPACPALRTLALQGGFSATLSKALVAAEADAQRRGLSEPTTEALLRQTVQASLIASNLLPKDALAAIQAVQFAERDCAGNVAALAALNGTASVIRAQLKFDTPTTIGGPGDAPIANPRLPSPGNLGVASYRSTIVTP